MIAFLRGIVSSASNEAVVLDVHGVGYKVNVTLACAATLSGMLTQEVSLHTQLIVREDDVQIYGFPSAGEINAFLLLLGVNGVGPRAALGILSYLSPQQLARAVTLEDVLALTKAPGVGKKIAQRIVLELKDKFAKSGLAMEMEESVATIADGSGASGVNPVEEAIDGLLALGYGAAEARDALARVKSMAPNSADAAELIKLSLRLLDRRK